MSPTITVLFIGFGQPDSALIISKLEQYYTNVISHFISTDLTFHKYMDTRPDILLLSHQQEDTHGLDALHALLDANLKLSIYMAFPEQVDDHEVEQYMNAGANNYFIMNNLDRLIHLLQPNIQQPTTILPVQTKSQPLVPPITQELRAIFFEEAPVPLIAVDTESTRILDASHQTLLDLGYQRETIQLLNLSDIWPDCQSGLTLSPDNITLLKDSDNQYVPVALSRRNLQAGGGSVQLYSYRKLPHPPVYREGTRSTTPFALRLPSPFQHIENVMFSMRYLIHHMNTSLTIFDSYKRLSNTHLPKDSFLYRYTQSISAVIDSDLLLTNRLKKIVTEPMVVYAASELEAVVEPLLAFCQNQNAGLVIRRDLSPVYPVEMPTNELHGALSEVVLNAMDAMEAISRPAHLHVTIRQIDNWATIEITDNGEGMSDQVKEQCVIPLFTTRSRRGAGLGLTITAAIMHRYNARMEIDTTTREGTTVRLSLPTTPTSGELWATQQTEEEETEIPVVVSG